MNHGSTITDQYHQEHKICAELGKGGQGIVYTTEDPDIAIKLVLTQDGEPYTDQAYIKKYHMQLDDLLTLPVTQGINLARPLLRLQDHAGYVMQQLRGMKPAESLFSITPNDVEDIKYPKWLDIFIKNMRFKEAYALLHYANTGSTKRRFEILMQCSAQLAKLHGQGLVYGDISPENVFFSEKLAFNHVWFIDADNLHFENIKTKKAVYTPGYGSPELVLGQVGTSARTDVYSFAVLAFKTLSLLHPFDGQKLKDSDDDWDSVDEDNESSMSLEAQAQAGLLPFIDDPDDDSNKNDTGIPRKLILTEKLQHLFNHTFNKAQTSPWKRPLIYHWPEALAEAVDTSIECPSCNMSYLNNYALSENRCPYCSAKTPSYFCIQRNAISQSSNSNVWRAVMSPENSEIILPKRFFTSFSIDDFDEEFARLHKENENWILSISFNSSEKVNVALNKSGEVFSPLISNLELTEEELKVGLLLQIEGSNPQKVRITLKEAK